MRIAEADNSVLFNVDNETIQKLAKMDLKGKKDLIINKKNLRQTGIEKDKGLYVLPMWIKKPKGFKGSASKNQANVCEGDQDKNQGFWTPF